MNFDCLALIIEFLETRHLIKLSAAHEHFRYAVKYNLRHRMSKKIVTFRSPYTDGELGQYTVGWQFDDYHGISESANEIHFKHFPIILNFLKQFGNLIQSLKIIHEDTTNATQKKYVWLATNRYCSENLTQLWIVDRNNGSLSFERPFSKVELFSLTGKFKHLTDGRMFPSTRELSLGKIEFDDANWLDHEFPLLNNLTVTMGDLKWTPEEKGLSVAEFDRFLRNNRNVQNLTLTYANPEVLESVASRLHHLKHLRLVFYDTDIPRRCNIQFVNLKTLIVNQSPLSLIEDITFDNLEEYEVNVYSHGWIESIKQNAGMRNSLRKLRIKRRLGDAEILQIADANLNLTEIHFHALDDLKVESIVRLIEGSHGLQKLCIYTLWNDWQTGIDELQDRFAQQWNINQILNYIDLKRKEMD